MSTPGESSDVLAELNLHLSDTFAINLASASALTWLVYDAALSFDREVKYIWRAEWKIRTVFYALARYYILLSLVLYVAVNTNVGLSEKFCKSWAWFNGFNAPWLSVIIGQSSLAYRIWSMYAHDRKILVFVSGALMLVTVISAAAVTVETKSLRFILSAPDLPLPGCPTSTGPNYIGLVIAPWIAALILSSFYFALILNRLQYQINSDTPFSRYSQYRNLTPLATLLLRDGAVYFFIISAAVSLNLIFSIQLRNRAIQKIAVSWLMAAYSVLSCRIILNLRVHLTSGPSGIDLYDVHSNEHIQTLFPSNSLHRRHKSQYEIGMTITEDVPLSTLSLHSTDIT